ncbi:MAG TPA: hypothetical protein VMV79_08195 [Alphaproteobacteria bacterium]|nr:hypothetical protein [Alphaproteobacteria bacterium]
MFFLERRHDPCPSAKQRPDFRDRVFSLRQKSPNAAAEIEISFHALTEQDSVRPRSGIFENRAFGSAVTEKDQIAAQEVDAQPAKFAAITFAVVEIPVAHQSAIILLKTVGEVYAISAVETRRAVVATNEHLAQMIVQRWDVVFFGMFHGCAFIVKANWIPDKFSFVLLEHHVQPFEPFPNPSRKREGDRPFLPGWHPFSDARSLFSAFCLPEFARRRVDRHVEFFQK